MAVTDNARDTEFSFSGSDFERVRKLIYQRAGISLHAGKQAMVYSRLSRRLRDVGYTSFADYLQWLEQAKGPQGESEWQEFVNCLTTNLTSFFREDHHFPLLAAELARNPGRRWRIWCNAASTGEEPYSLAITVAEALGTPAPVQILCSDIDTKVLARAEQGVYPADARGLGPELLKRYFMRGTGNNNGFIRVKPELRRLVQFRSFNLMDTHWSLGEPFDIVFCRNVMIYFDRPTQAQLVNKFYRYLKPGGYLFIGHSESLQRLDQPFKAIAPTIYQKEA